MGSKEACTRDAYSRIKEIRTQLALITNDLSFGKMQTPEGDEQHSQTLDALLKTTSAVNHFKHVLIGLLGAIAIESQGEKKG